MYNPFPYDDPKPVNRPRLEGRTVNALVTGSPKVFAHIASKLSGGAVVALDGYTAADFGRAANLLRQQLHVAGRKTRVLHFRDCYKSEEKLWELVDRHLSWDRSEDPTLLFGRLYKGGYEGLLNPRKVEAFRWSVQHPEDGTVTIVEGAGCLVQAMRDLYDVKVWLDVTPKESILRIRRGAYVNLGMEAPLTTPLIIRRCYYCDFEVAVHLRRELLAGGGVDFYVESDHPEDMKLLPYDAFTEVMDSLSTYPFRCKPVYLEGVWGGTYVKKLRHLPDTMRNCAWVFDLIPMEVSILVQVGGTVVEFPFSTFFMKEGTAVLGEGCVNKFGGYFPIRFNYDDSYHSTGNMSIQCHSGSTYNKEHYDELGRQDESYYVVATGHDAKTFIGFRDDADIPQFFRDIEAADTEHKPVDYMKYVSYEESRPGLQVMLPAGTIHSSGRNQVILEIGSLTVGSYTYKMYDYLRLDFDGKQRPIHTKLGKLNVATDRTTSWIRSNVAVPPRLVRETPDGKEFVVGEHDLLYFSLRRLEFDRRMEDDTAGRFHVLTLVDGERVRVRSLDHPEKCYEADFMDLVVVPASMGRYVVENLGVEPIRIHKTMLKDGFENDEL
ncbi:MAG: class I mannose-6-phosphate isomerase [Bacteroidales bacterium]|nr:class I mannose-6-phosphate isomerase [Bacteroidales bacterium]